jgi:hypothetical protein
MGPANFLPSALPPTRKLSKGLTVAERLGQTYSIGLRYSMTNLFNLTGKAALVTGGNGGIGLGIARGLAQAGARVGIIARNADKSRAAAKALAEETGVPPLVLTADVSSPDQVAAVIDEAKNGLGRIDILFNNAGISIRKLPQEGASSSSARAWPWPGRRTTSRSMRFCPAGLRPN